MMQKKGYRNSTAVWVFALSNWNLSYADVKKAVCLITWIDKENTIRAISKTVIAMFEE
jgi:hypothetical protein